MPVTIAPIPSSLPILPLYNKKVLLPSVVSRVVLRSKDSIFLLRKLHRTFDPKTPTIVGCVPVIRKDSAQTGTDNNDKAITNGSAVGDDDDVTQAEPTTAPQVPLHTHQRRPVRGKRSDDPVDSQTSETLTVGEDLFKFGCAARIVRIERIGFGGFAIFVEGKF